MSYRDDAFFQVENLFENEPFIGDNDPFLYPSKSIRFLEAQEQLKKTLGVPTSYKLTRGYIRGLDQPGLNIAVGKTYKPLRCNFQFNPQQISQSVSMREDVYLPILQDPTQFTQPFGGSVNFNFDLLFDRSMEVSQGLEAVQRPTFLTDDNYSNEPRDVGVISDLQVFYSVIGQGFSAGMMNFQAARLRDAVIKQLAQQAAAEATTATTEDASGTTGTPSAGDVSSMTNNFNTEINVGNSAFLMPNPVRVIFSSLFMIDGFVTGTQVDFLKFSTNMVPLQARVSVSMNAVYIGFARDKTFLTEQLATAGDNIQRDKDQDDATKAEIIKTLSTFSNLTFNPKEKSSITSTPIYEYAFTDATLDRNQDSSRIHDYSWKRGIRIYLNNPNYAFIKNLNATISLSGTFALYGKYDSEDAAKTAAQKIGSAGDISSSSNLVGLYKFEIPSLLDTVRLDTNLDNYYAYASDLSNAAARALDISEYNEWDHSDLYSPYKNGYYAYRLEYNLKWSLPSGYVDALTASGSRNYYIRGSEGAFADTPIVWKY